MEWVEQPAGTCLTSQSALFIHRLQLPMPVLTMGQCGITSSKTVLVFLNLIFWVSFAGLPQFWTCVTVLELLAAVLTAADADICLPGGGWLIWYGTRKHTTEAIGMVVFIFTHKYNYKFLSFLLKIQSAVLVARGQTITFVDPPPPGGNLRLTLILQAAERLCWFKKQSTVYQTWFRLNGNIFIAVTIE